MPQQVPIERVDRRIVDVGREYALAQVVEYHDASGAPQPAECFLVQFGPDAGSGTEDQKPHAFAAVSERQHKQPRTTVLASLRVAHHRAGAVIDLRFFARRGLNHGSRFRFGCSAQLAYKPLDTLVTDSETVAVD